MTFFEIFFSVAHLLIKTKLFCIYQIFISSEVQRNHGGQTKNDATGQTKYFFLNFLFCCTSTHRNKTFLFLPKFISSAVQRNHGGTKSVTTTNKQQQTNKRTNEQTNTTNVHNSPPGFFQNPRANDALYFK